MRRPPSRTSARASTHLGEAWTLSGAKPTSTAGRPSYTVRIAPKDDGGLLGAGALAWDAVKGVPLRFAVYAQGHADPVLELKATDISLRRGRRRRPARLDARRRRGRRRRVRRPATRAQGRQAEDVTGVAAVQKRLGFELAAPKELAGLPRKEVRLVRFGDEAGALSVYGEGLGGIVVLQHQASLATSGRGERHRAPAGQHRRRHGHRARHRARHLRDLRARRRELHRARLGPAGGRRERGAGPAMSARAHRGPRARQALRRRDGGRQRRPDRRGRGRLRLPRPQRRRQDDLAADAARADPARRGHREAVRARPPRGGGRAPWTASRVRRGAALLPVHERAPQPRAGGGARRRRRRGRGSARRSTPSS